MIEFRVAGAIKTPSAIEVKVGGQVRTIKLIEAQTSGGPKVIYRVPEEESFTVSLNSEAIDTGKWYITGEHITATPSGGSAPFTYAWSWTYNGSGSLSVYESATASPRFMQYNGDPNDPVSPFSVTVTDANGVTASASGYLSPAGLEGF